MRIIIRREEPMGATRVTVAHSLANEGRMNVDFYTHHVVVLEIEDEDRREIEPVDGKMRVLPHPYPALRDAMKKAFMEGAEPHVVDDAQRGLVSDRFDKFWAEWSGETPAEQGRGWSRE